jgi:hypothetical protein
MVRKADHIPGEDAFGQFVIESGICPKCGQAGLIVRYGPEVHLPQGISCSATILRDGRSVGLLCGDYGKLHRQVTHIESYILNHQKEGVSNG